MTTKKLIVPFDFSAQSEAALEYAAALAREIDATLIIVHVQELPVVHPEGSYYYGLPVPDDGGIASMLENVRPSIQGVAFEHRLLKGDPASQVASLAAKEKAEMIVMSSLGRAGLGRLILGSIAEAVMRKAECPVLIVKSRPVTERLPCEEAIVQTISYE